jgi:hypothetical protein
VSNDVDYVKLAAKALSDLNVLAGIVGLLESSVLSVDCQRTELRCITMCKAEQVRCLRRYDRYCAAARRSRV